MVALMLGYEARTVGGWLSKYLKDESLERKNSDSEERKKFKSNHRNWILDLVNHKPLLFSHEIAEKFCQHFRQTISEATVCRILRENGYTKKIAEKRALQIREEEIFRFSTELSELRPLYHQLMFLDEVAFDNKKMLRRRGWFLRGSYPFVREVFKRSERISMLAFLGVSGLVGIYNTEGTFDRSIYFAFIRELISSGEIEAFPGKNSVWILDGASIHLDANISTYLRSMGVFVVYLPAFCPFFNVIEYFFGYVKRDCQKIYNGNGDELRTVVSVCNSFLEHDFSPVFHHCGYNKDGTFDLLRNLMPDHDQALDL
jgi:transposase